MNNGGGNGGGSFKVKHGSYEAEVTDVYEAGAGEVGDVVGEREMRIESNTKITGTGIRGERSRDVNKDLTPKDQDKDKDKDLTPKDQDKDKYLKYVLKDKDEDKDHS